MGSYFLRSIYELYQKTTMTNNSKQPPVFKGTEISYLMMVVPDFYTNHKKTLTKDGKELHEQVWRKILDYRDFYN